MDINDPIKTTVEEIRKVLNIENVIGEPVETDEFLMIPVTRMGMGFGAGMSACGCDVFIQGQGNDSVTLQNVSLAALKANPSDFAFHA